jgi:hypothetical protein
VTNKERNEIKLKVKKIVREWRRRIKSRVKRESVKEIKI